MSTKAVLLIAILLLTTGFQQAKPTPAQPERTGSGGAERIETSQPAVWAAFAPKGGGFSVMLPGTPAETSLDTDTSSGVVTSPAYHLKSGAFRYLISYLDYPFPIEGAERDRIVEKAAEKAITDKSGSVVSNKAILLSGYPGRELKGEVRGLPYRCRFYLVKKRLYALIMFMPVGEADSVNAAKFFDSFELVPDKPGPAVSTPQHSTP